jgi:preprotein translocase subunit SecB
MSQIATPRSTKGNGHDEKEQVPSFNVHSIYLKDLSFEAPHSPTVFHEEWKPKIDFDLQMGSQVLSEEEGIYEVVLHVTVTIKLGEGEQEKPAFLIDIQQAGAFSVHNLPKETLKQVLATTCATMLFPYARETISSLATRGGFPQLILPPVNFDAMYAHHMNTQAEEQKERV